MDRRRSRGSAMEMHPAGIPTIAFMKVTGHSRSHYYPGKRFLLRVSAGKVNSVRYKGRRFEVACTSPDKARELMKAWYREHAKLKFAEYAGPVIARFARYGVTPASLHVQEMENRWGSCTPKGKIILNTELIKAPRPCIEYVIAHEMCHLPHPDHTAASFPCSKARARLAALERQVGAIYDVA